MSALPQHDPIQVAASVCAHEFSAKLLAMGIHPPAREIVGSAIIEIGGIRVVVSVTAYEGPARLILNETGKRVLGVEGTKAKMPPLHAKIIDVLDRETPRKAEWIAAKIKRSCSGSFRSALSDMVGFGLIRKGEGGYLIPQ